tara:strand:- start:114 stop:317 length:204 start_codon:yes stop_codon:yes gene_type:complete
MRKNVRAMIYQSEQYLTAEQFFLINHAHHLTTLTIQRFPLPLNYKSAHISTMRAPHQNDEIEIFCIT